MGAYLVGMLVHLERRYGIRSQAKILAWSRNPGWRPFPSPTTQPGSRAQAAITATSRQHQDPCFREPGARCQARDTTESSFNQRVDSS